MEIAEVVGNEFFGDHEPGAKVALHCDEGQKRCVDNEEGAEFLHPDWLAGDLRAVELVVEEGNAHEGYCDDKIQGKPAFASLQVGVAYLENEKQKGLEDPEGNEVLEVVAENEVSQHADSREDLVIGLLERFQYLFVVPQEEEGEGHVDKGTQPHQPELGIDFLQGNPEEEPARHDHEAEGLQDHPLRNVVDRSLGPELVDCEEEQEGVDALHHC